MSFCISLPTNVDVLFARGLFPAYESGIYASASVFGKLQFFVAYSVVWSLFPKVVKHKSSEALLMRSVFYVISVSSVVALIYALVPDVLITTFFGSAYSEASSLVKSYGLAMLLFSILTVIISYHIAKGEVGFVYVFLMATVFEIFGFFNAKTPMDLIKTIFLGNLLGLILWLVLTVFSRFNRFQNEKLKNLKKILR
jgi:O-antigen/teichoic acid export membrane protein